MISTKLACLSLGISLLALFFGIQASKDLNRTGSRPPGIETLQPDSDAHRPGLSHRLQQLELQVEELQLRRVNTQEDSRMPVTPVAEQEPDSRAQILALEQRLLKMENALEASRGDFEAENQLASAMSREYVAEQRLKEKQELRQLVVQWTEQALDPTLEEGLRLRGLRGLRGNHLADGTNARVPVLPEMIHLARTSENGASRADVWRQMHGVKEPALMEALLDALAHDSFGGAREEAAESLDSFLPDPRVEAALRYAMDHDASAGVRSQAARSLGLKNR